MVPQGGSSSLLVRTLLVEYLLCALGLPPKEQKWEAQAPSAEWQGERSKCRRSVLRGETQWPRGGKGSYGSRGQLPNLPALERQGSGFHFGKRGGAHSRPRKCLRKCMVCARKSQLQTRLECEEGCQQAIKDEVRLSEARQRRVLSSCIWIPILLPMFTKQGSDSIVLI